MLNENQQGNNCYSFSVAGILALPSVCELLDSLCYAINTIKSLVALKFIINTGTARAHTRAHTRTHTHAHTRIRTRTHTHVRTHTRAHARTRAHTRAHTHTHTRTCKYLPCLLAVQLLMLYSNTRKQVLSSKSDQLNSSDLVITTYSNLYSLYHEGALYLSPERGDL